LAKWFHANDIPGRKANCPYFRSALKLAQQFGDEIPFPCGREIDGPLLDTNYANWRLTWLNSNSMGRIVELQSCVIHGKVNTCSIS
jgi:hypothetical protein